MDALQIIKQLALEIEINRQLLELERQKTAELAKRVEEFEAKAPQPDPAQG